MNAIGQFLITRPIAFWYRNDVLAQRYILVNILVLSGLECSPADPRRPLED